MTNNWSGSFMSPVVQEELHPCGRMGSTVPCKIGLLQIDNTNFPSTSKAKTKVTRASWVSKTIFECYFTAYRTRDKGGIKICSLPFDFLSLTVTKCTVVKTCSFVYIITRTSETLNRILVAVPAGFIFTISEGVEEYRILIDGISSLL